MRSQGLQAWGVEAKYLKPVEQKQVDPKFFDRIRTTKIDHPLPTKGPSHRSMDALFPWQRSTAQEPPKPTPFTLKLEFLECVILRCARCFGNPELQELKFNSPEYKPTEVRWFSRSTGLRFGMVSVQLYGLIALLVRGRWLHGWSSTGPFIISTGS